MSAHDRSPKRRAAARRTLSLFSGVWLIVSLLGRRRRTPQLPTATATAVGNDEPTRTQAPQARAPNTSSVHSSPEDSPLNPSPGDATPADHPLECSTTAASHPGVLNTKAGWLGDPRRCAAADGFLLLLAAATAVACFLNGHGAVRLLLLVAAACLIPGGALLTRLLVEDMFEAIGLAIGLGLTIEAFGAFVMVWTGWWHPFGWAIALGAAACALLLLDLRHNSWILRKSV